MMSTLEILGIDFTKREHTHYKFSHDPFMDLTVETWIESSKAGDIMKVSVCHYGEQNGDMMRDPEMVFRLGLDSTIEIPEYFRNDYVGLEQFVYPIVNEVQMINPKLLQDLKAFARIWSKNIIEQGFTKESKIN